MVNDASSFTLERYREALDSGHHTQPFILSVGSTPTAHASGSKAKELLKGAITGDLELHAGNYCVLDLQQQSTGMIQQCHIAQRVRATVISYYPGRGKNGEDEALIDAAAIALSKDTGPSGHFGQVVGKPWILSKISQEHGILTCTEPGAKLDVGDFVDIIGQHACLIAAVSPSFVARRSVS